MKHMFITYNMRGWWIIFNHNQSDVVESLYSAKSAPVDYWRNGIIVEPIYWVN